MRDFCIGVFGLFFIFNVIKLLNFLREVVDFRGHRFIMSGSSCPRFIHRTGTCPSEVLLMGSMCSMSRCPQWLYNLDISFI